MSEKKNCMPTSHLGVYFPEKSYTPEDVKKALTCPVCGKMSPFKVFPPRVVLGIPLRRGCYHPENGLYLEERKEAP